MLNLLIFLPVLGALAIMCGAPARKITLISAIAQMLVAVAVFFSYDLKMGGYQFEYSVMLVPEWKLSYLLAADGLSVVMLLLTGIVTFAAASMTPTEGTEERPMQRKRLYFACVLLISAGCAGAFAAQDLFFFYAFHELALIPTFLLIGIFGFRERQDAAWRITVYLALGSIILLVGLVDLYFALPADLRTLNMMDLAMVRDAIPAASQTRPFLFLLIGFGILVSLFPFHSWAPNAYASAPTPATMLHAGVLKKFGLYGLLRLALPLLPEGAHQCSDLLLVLLVCNIIYIGFVTINQKHLDLMLGYSSVMHMGYIFLGIASLNIVGTSGAALLMFAHGLGIALLFAICGMIRENSPTLAFDKLGGAAKAVPMMSLAFGIGAFASIGLPGFANFASETMIFFGAFKPNTSPSEVWKFQLAVGFALWGVVISAVYMLRAYRAIFQGSSNPSTERWTDLTKGQRVPVLVLILTLGLAGVAPGIFLSLIKPSIEALLK